MRPFSIIVAFDREYGIGIKGQLAWQLPSDLKHFKAITTTTTRSDQYNAVIMGRTTWDSLPEKFRPLPKRLNIVLTQNKQLTFPSGVIAAECLEQALVIEDPNVEHVFVIGGGQVYKAALEHPACRSIYVTHVKGDFSCDTFFPAISPQYMLISSSETLTENGITFQFCHYMKHF